MKKIVKTVMAGLLCVGSTVCAAQTLTVCTSTSYTIPSAEGVSGATYEWWENGVKVSGTSAAYTNTAGQSSAGTYVYVRRAYTATCGWQNSNAFFVYVTGSVSAPVITKPADGCAGVNYVFTVPVVSGATYAWTGGGTANGNSYTYSNATAGAKTVTVRATTNVGGAVCQSAAAGATATAYAIPAFTTQPVGTAVCSGSAATLSAAASNATAYRWYKDNAATTEGSGTASQTYTTAALTAAATYSVVATNGGVCSTTSSNAVVTMASSGCSNFTYCSGFTYVSTDIASNMTWQQGIDFCAGKGAGWRMPDQNEWKCMCQYNANLPGGPSWGVNWTSYKYATSYAYAQYIKEGDGQCLWEGTEISTKANIRCIK